MNQNSSLLVEEYNQALNTLGQTLITALIQSTEELPAHCRSSKVITQGIAAFLANIIYRQFPNNPESCEQMLKDISQLVKTQLNNIAQRIKL